LINYHFYLKSVFCYNIPHFLSETQRERVKESGEREVESGEREVEREREKEKERERERGGEGDEREDFSLKRIDEIWYHFRAAVSSKRNCCEL
jgi:hypothetical protein